MNSRFSGKNVINTIVSFSMKKKFSVVDQGKIEGRMKECVQVIFLIQYKRYSHSIVSIGLENFQVICIICYAPKKIIQPLNF